MLEELLHWILWIATLLFAASVAWIIWGPI